MTLSDCRKGDHVITPSGRTAKICRVHRGRVDLLYIDGPADDRVTLQPKFLRPWDPFVAHRGRRPLLVI
jgi:preprotein translocase subunit YajC